VNPSSEGRRELDSVVVNIELTLVSIIQGVALFFLTDNARALMSMRHWDALLYVAAGLCVIFIFWSRSIIHTLTLIRWPMALSAGKKVSAKISSTTATLGASPAS